MPVNRHRPGWRIAILLPLAALAGTAEAWAGCRVDVSPVTFGIVDLRRTTFANGSVRVECDAPTSFTIGLASGPGGGDRYLVGAGNDHMLYKLFRDPSYTEEWGDGLGSHQGVGGTADGRRPTELSIFGAIPVQGSFQPGGYHDSLLVTLTF